MSLPPGVQKQLEELIANQNGGKRRSKKTSKHASKKVSKKSSKKGSRKQKGGSQAFMARIALAKFIANDLKVKGGVPIQKLIKMYADKVKAKKPDIDSIALIDEAKKEYLADKPNGPMEKLKKINAGTMARGKSSKKRSSKKTSKK